MSPMLAIALGFAAIIVGGTLAVAVNDAVERWWEGVRPPEPGSDPGTRPRPPVPAQAVRTAVAGARRPAATVRVRERRPAPDRSLIVPPAVRRRPQ